MAATGLLVKVKILFWKSSYEILQLYYHSYPQSLIFIAYRVTMPIHKWQWLLPEPGSGTKQLLAITRAQLKIMYKELGTPSKADGQMEKIQYPIYFNASTASSSGKSKK